MLQAGERPGSVLAVCGAPGSFADIADKQADDFDLPGARNRHAVHADPPGSNIAGGFPLSGSAAAPGPLRGAAISALPGSATAPLSGTAISALACRGAVRAERERH